MQPTNSIEQKFLFKALAEGDSNQVKALVSRNPEILNCFDSRNFGATPLTFVCFSDRMEMVDLLLDLGADPNQKSDWSMGPWSPLHCALFRRDRPLTERLLARGAILDVHTAAGLGLPQKVADLLDENPERVNERGGDGCFPLHFADSIEAAELLLSRGAFIDGRCIDHYSTPVQYLCTARPHVAQYLLSRGAEPDIFSTILCGDCLHLEKLLETDPLLVNARVDQTFFPPGNEHDVHNILTFSVGHGATPMHAAASGNRPEAIPFLIAKGADINARGGYDMATPLHLAAWNDNLEAASALVKLGADMDAKSGKLHNNSPAGWAVVAGALPVFEMLLSRGAKIFPWFIEDAKCGCNGQFDQVRHASSEARNRIFALLNERNI